MNYDPFNKKHIHELTPEDLVFSNQFRKVGLLNTKAEQYLQKIMQKKWQRLQIRTEVGFLLDSTKISYADLQKVKAYQTLTQQNR